MAAIWYIGGANVRSISTAEWAAAGIPAVQPTVWDLSNGWSIPKAGFNQDQIDLLDADDEFDIEGADGPRPGSTPISDPHQPATRNWVLERMSDVANDSIPIGLLGTASGVATLGSNSKIPDAQLPTRLDTAQLNGSYAAKSLETTALTASQKGVVNGIAPLDSTGIVVDTYLPTRLQDAQLSVTIDDQIEGSEYLPATYAPRSPKAPTPVIWDTDWWTDVDDAVALRLLCRAEQIGLIDIRAIIANTSFYKTPGSISAMLTYEGHGPVPIGVNSYVPATGVPSYQNGLFDVWPHHDGYATDALGSTEVYRRTLAAADNGTVDIISVGYLTALYDLLQSPADGISGLTGLQLVTAKVRHLWVMGGMWPKGGENNFNRDATAKTAANYVVANWPSDITFQGFEVGASIYTGQLLVGTQLTDPLANALLDYSVAATGRQSWDPMLTWMACIGDLELAGYTAVRGTATVNSSTGDNTFTESPTGKHYYVKKAQSDSWFSRDLNARLFPNSSPLGVTTPPGARAGTEIPLTVLHVPAAPPFVRASRAVGITADLISGFHVDDLSSLADAAVVSHWPDRTFKASVRQNKGSSYCPTVQTVGGKRGVLFASQKWLWSDTISLPKSLTVYAEVYWPTVPSATQTAIAGDNSLSVAVRSFHLGANSTGKVQAVAYDGVPGFADATADTVAATSWQIIAARVSTTQVEAFLGAVSNGTTSITGRNDGQIGIALGSRNTDTSAEPFLGYARQFRVYGVSHDSTQRAAVLAEMAAV